MAKPEPNEWDRFYAAQGATEPEPETVDEMMGLVLDILSFVGFCVLAYGVYYMCVSL